RVFLDNILDRNRVDGDVSPRNGQLDVAGVVESSARRDRCQVACERVRVDRNDDLVRLASPKVAILAGPNGVPGWQTLNVGREEVLARNRDAHLENCPQDGVVGRGTAGAILGANYDRKIVYNFSHRTPNDDLSLPYGFKAMT